MRKLLFAIFLLCLCTSLTTAQLVVKDTLLLAFKYETFWGSSSELEQGMYADLGKYGAVNLGDNNVSTCWAEGSNGDGSGEFVWMTIPKNVESLRIKNGYEKNEKVFYSNNRLKTVEFELFACYEPPAYVTESHHGFFISNPLDSYVSILEDMIGCQEVELDFDWQGIYSQLIDHEFFDEDRFVLRMKIIDVYEGSKWNDACISDIHFVYAPYFDILPDEHGLIKVSDNKTDTLFYNPEYIFQVVEISPNGQWIIFILMPSDIISSRVETIYKLYNTQQEKFFELEDVYEMFGFTEKDGKLYLKGSDNEFNDLEVLLED